METNLNKIIARVHGERIIGMHRLADWWFAKFTGRPIHDNGARGHAPSAMAGMFAGLIADRHPVDASDANRDRFRAALVARSQPTAPDGDEERVWWHDHIGTDYHPDRALAEAMEACGIDHSRAPWKTHTSYKGGGLIIEVSDGYCAPHQLIYMAPVLDVLVRLAPVDLGAIDATVPVGRLNVSYAVDVAISAFGEMARRARHEDESAMAYAADAIARARDAIEKRAA